MRNYQILYRNASGETALTRTITARNADESKQHCTAFVLQNFIAVYEVPENHAL